MPGRRPLELRRRSEVNKRDPESPLSPRIDSFESVVANPDFPCVFATRALVDDELLFGSLENLDCTLGDIAAAVGDAVQVIAMDPAQVVILFIGAGSTSLEEDNALAAAITRELMHSSELDWPLDQSRDPADPLWILWVNGVDLFVNYSTPNHALRKSRNVGSSFAMILQSRSSFDRFAGRNNSTRTVIRKRLERYDGIPVHAALGSFGDVDNREIEQFFLGDGTETVDLLPGARKCPFH